MNSKIHKYPLLQVLRNPLLNFSIGVYHTFVVDRMLNALACNASKDLEEIADWSKTR